MEQGICHKVFPKIIYESFYDDHINFREIVLNTIQFHCDNTGLTSEYTKHVSIHHDLRYENFYKFTAECVRDYLRRLETNYEIFSLNLVKSWFNVTANSNNPTHNHADAHVSFAYYVNTPTNFQKEIIFHNDFCGVSSSIDLFSGLNFMNTSNFNNDYIWKKFATEQGKIFVFPGNMPHSVSNLSYCSDQENPVVPIFSYADAEKNRICISGDFILTYKEVCGKHLGLQPIYNWKIF